MFRWVRQSIAFVWFMATGGAVLFTDPEDIAATLRFYRQHGPCTECYCWPCWCGNKPRYEAPSIE